jgi:hypothetical protein
VGFPVDLMTQVFVFIGAGVSIAFCIRLAQVSGTTRELGSWGLLATIAVLFILPGSVSGQRDHIALIVALPFLTLIGIRASNRDANRLLAILAGVGGGAMVAIRPHYALVLGLTVFCLVSGTSSNLDLSGVVCGWLDRHRIYLNRHNIISGLFLRYGANGPRRVCAI